MLSVCLLAAHEQSIATGFHATFLSRTCASLRGYVFVSLMDDIWVTVVLEIATESQLHTLFSKAPAL